MLKLLLTTIILLSSALCSKSYAQIQWDSDFGGYSQRTGNYYTHNRGGETVSGIRAGNTIFWDWSNGTRGTSIYGGSGRFDTYSNPSWRSTRSYYTPSTPSYSPRYKPYRPRY